LTLFFALTIAPFQNVNAAAMPEFSLDYCFYYKTTFARLAQHDRLKQLVAQKTNHGTSWSHLADDMKEDEDGFIYMLSANYDDGTSYKINLNCKKVVMKPKISGCYDTTKISQLHDVIKQHFSKEYHLNYEFAEENVLETIFDDNNIISEVRYNTKTVIDGDKLVLIYASITCSPEQEEAAASVKETTAPADCLTDETTGKKLCCVANNGSPINVNELDGSIRTVYGQTSVFNCTQGMYKACNKNGQWGDCQDIDFPYFVLYFGGYDSYNTDPTDDDWFIDINEMNIGKGILPDDDRFSVWLATCKKGAFNPKTRKCEGEGTNTAGFPKTLPELRSAVTAKSLRISELAGAYDPSKKSAWKTANGNFNGARLASDSVAGVTLGTVGALITANVIKKNQINNGFNDLNCATSGTKIANWGDVFMMRAAAIKPECEKASGGRNNIFVWAAKDSTGADYATLREDTKKPDNNACWVRVDIASDDPNIRTDVFKQRWFMTGARETCGAWLDEGFVRQKILDAKKTKRTWGTVAGAVGGAAVGVGAMELFGNKLIGGKVEGQKSLKGDELLRSQMLVAGDEAGWKEYESAKNELSRLCGELKSAGGTAKECE
jgi:hypothetical protein